MDNLAIFHLIFDLNGQNPLLDKLMIFGAESLIYIAIILVFLLAFRDDEKKSLLLIIFGFPISVLIITILHFFFLEQRPYLTHNLLPLIKIDQSFSFPSVHTTFASLIGFAYLFNKSRWAPLFLFFMIWVGISRVYVGVHYPLDIVGGILVGVGSLIIGRFLKNSLKS